MDSQQSVTDRPIASPGTAKAGRLIGIDVARGCAVLGMFATHLGPQDPHNWLQQLFNGRAAGLFALLAGVSVALISGGSRVRTGVELRSRRIQLGVRALLLLLLGLSLSALGTTVKEILSVYAVLFLIAIPLLRLRTAALAWCAAISAVVGPVVSFLLRSTVLAGYTSGVTPQFGDLTSIHGWARLVEGLVVTGPFPVLTWIPFLFAGMAIGRSDLKSWATQLRVLVIGVALAVGAYAASWAIMGPLGGWRAVADSLHVSIDQAHDAAASGLGAVPTSSPLFLLDTAGHSGSPMEIIAVTGCALAVIGASLLLASRLPLPFLPLASVGALPLTAYAGHIVLIALMEYGILPGAGEAILAGSYLPLLVTVVVTLVVLTLWRMLLGRGPLEWLLYRLSSAPAKLVS